MSMFLGKVITYNVVPIKGKEIRYMHGQALRISGGWDNGHMKLLKLSASFTPGNIPVRC